jgi:hypothetical protein
MAEVNPQHCGTLNRRWNCCPFFELKSICIFQTRWVRHMKKGLFLVAHNKPASPFLEARPLYMLSKLPTNEIHIPSHQVQFWLNGNSSK